MSLYMGFCALCAYFIKGLCGFANTLVFSTLLSFTTDNVQISPVDLLLGYPANALMAFKERKALQTRIWLPLSALVIAGCIPGALALKHMDARMLKVVFGAAVCFLGIEMLSRIFVRGARQAPRFITGLVGVAAGLMCGLFGVGALLAAYVGRTAKDPRVFRGNLSAVFFIENTFRIFFYAATGILTFETVHIAIVLIPFMMAGLGMGILLSGRISDKVMMCVVAALLIFSGGMLIITNR